MDQDNLNAANAINAGDLIPPPAQVEPQRDTNIAQDDEGLAPSIARELLMLSRGSPNYGTLCIYRVPEKYRNQNQEAYTPRLVSIGFIHHGQSQLQGMEEYKLKYLHHFIHTFRVSLQELAKFVQTQEKLVCDCYEDIHISNHSKGSKKPYEVILLDGIFVVELFLKNHFPIMREDRDIIFDNPLVASDILHDLLLVENQLPLRFLTALFNTFVSSNVKKYLDNNAVNPPSFNQLVQKYFKNVCGSGELFLRDNFFYAKHLVEFLYILHTQEKDNILKYRKLVGKQLDHARCPTVTELKAAGVKFKPQKGDRFLNVAFIQETGILVIPQVTVNDSAETFLRNLLAFEQSGYHSKDITSYVILMDNLIDTPKDVDVLVEHKILKNDLGSSDDVAQLFNNLHKEILNDPREFLYLDQCRELNAYSRDWLHNWEAKRSKWFAMLRNDYFGTPWSIISVSAAIVLLVLTIVQTVCSVLQVKMA
ncbi:OLC1v1038562C1 [Oldenlandia corymbosa var. corymbosa]|uniref:OLC1v1038562C1 n=1 Tax=Oldenlandia corymbosa var. corymbosa TaxID=529605 RepID=A0AAV1D022_OLDCO|nr:OLC1v1038562C1 [Oldenlandia corymbosa var. corymbosa]